MADDRFVCQGDVNITLEQSMRLWADYVAGNLASNTLSAHAVRLQVPDGYFTAHRATKLPDASWQLRDGTYTTCDHTTPHWSVAAKDIRITPHDTVHARNLVFKIGDRPVFWLPYAFIPINVQSGLLLPRFMIDFNNGLGIRQEYYTWFNRHAGATHGIELWPWRGFILDTTCDWTRGPDDSMSGVVQGAYRWDKPSTGYWLTFQDFHPWLTTPWDTNAHTLAQINVGGDARLGWRFVPDIDAIDDTINSSLQLRVWRPTMLTTLLADYTAISRLIAVGARPEPVPSAELRINSGYERIDRYVGDQQTVVTLLPHLELNTTYKALLSWLYYRQDIFVDRAMLDQYANPQAGNVLCHDDVSALRCYYAGDLTLAKACGPSMLTGALQPVVQLVSNHAVDKQRPLPLALQGNSFGPGAYRCFLRASAEFVLPECVFDAPDTGGMCALQPSVQWDYCPYIYQNGWYHFDYWDRIYPQQQIVAKLHNRLRYQNVDVTLDLEQGYDVVDNDQRFFLDRLPYSKHLLPLRIAGAMMHEKLQVSLVQEYEWRQLKVMQSAFSIVFTDNRLQLSLSYLYQDKALQHKRRLLAHIPHIILLNLALPLTSATTLVYQTQLSARTCPHFAVVPIMHRLCWEYEGHCWGCSIGFEAVNYNKESFDKQARALVLSLYLGARGVQTKQ